MLKKALFVSFLGLYLFTFSAEALNWDEIKYDGYVNDYADLLSPEQEKSLENTIYEHFASTTNEIAIVTVPDMSGDYIENFAFRLFEKWGVGDENKDNGVLFLISKNNRKMRIEVGYGLEPILTDSKTRIILDEYVKPEFKNENYVTGIKNGLDRIIEVLNTNSNKDLISTSANTKINFKKIFNFIANIFPLIFIFGFIFLQWLLSVMARTKSWWLGGVIGAGIGSIFILFGGLTILFEILTGIFIALGFIIDYFISKNYKEHKNGIKDGPPDWWSGGTWGPGGSSSTWSSSDFGGFGGGMSGGGGSSGDW